MHSSYFSAILDFYTEYKEGVNIFGLPADIEREIEKIFGVSFKNGCLRIPKKDCPRFFKFGSPFYNHSKQVKIMISQLEIPRKRAEICPAYIAAVLDIDAKLFYRMGGRDTVYGIYLKGKNDFWSKILSQPPDGKGRFKVSSRNRIISLCEPSIPYLIWRKDEFINFRDAVFDQDEEAIKKLKKVTVN